MEQTNRGRQLRNDPTGAEVALWRAISARKVAGVRFDRQVSIGPFVCDFVSRRARMFTEVDGGHRAVEAQGYQVLRFWNDDVLKNLQGVFAEIERVLAALPSPSLSREREGS